MVLIIEIILTVRAWRKGWGALALLPLGIGLVIAFLTGVAVGAANGSVDGISGLLLLLDLLVVGVLSLMNWKVPGRKAGQKEPPEIVDVEWVNG